MGRFIAYFRGLCLCLIIIGTAHLSPLYAYASHQDQDRIQTDSEAAPVNPTSPTLGPTLTPPIPPYEISDDIDKTLRQGEHFAKIWRDKSKDDKALDIFGAIDVAAPPYILWDIMLNCDISMKIVNSMKNCQVVETSDDGTWDIRKQEFEIAFFLPRTRTLFRSDYQKNQSIFINRAGGDLKTQVGVWRLLALDENRTRITYRARLEPKIALPRRILKRILDKDTPELLGALRLRAETAYQDHNAAYDQEIIDKDNPPNP